MELRFTVWQFVRLMVYLEDGKNLARDQSDLYAAWQDVWSDLDKTLGTLAESDPEAYSGLMMDQDVIIEDATPAQANTAREVLEAVMAEIDAALDHEADEDLLISLKFERRELRQLARKFARMAQDV